VTVLEIRRWKAFLRLNGETLVEHDQDILNEFKGFVQALKRVGIEYSIIVNVEGETESLANRAIEDSPMTSDLSPRKGTEVSGD
jgi:hypothetical protein